MKPSITSTPTFYPTGVNFSSPNMEEDLGSTDWVYCPYDPNHRMKYSKFHNHFVKCQRAHPEDPREQCPYYASELVHPDDMKEHLVTCKYRVLYPDLFGKDTTLPVYDAPCHFNFDEESDEDEDTETCVSVMHDDKSSLFSATTKSYRPNSTVSVPLRGVQEEFAEGRSDASSAFEYVVKDTKKNVSKRRAELIPDMDSSESIHSLSNSLRSTSIGSISPSSSSSPSTSVPSLPSTPSVSSFNQKKGFGRGMMVQKLLRSSHSSIDSVDQLPAKGLGRGALFRLRMNVA